MKKRVLLLLAACLVVGSLAWAMAAADEDDPLASLSYLTGTFTERVEDKLEEKLDESDEDLLKQLGKEDSTPVTVASTWQEKRLKNSDTLRGVTGTGALLLAGTMEVTYESGAVVDVTTGTVVESGTALEKNHRYLVAEDTAADFTVTSPTAVMDYQGT